MKTNDVTMVVKKLNKQTVEFHNLFIQRTVEWAHKKYAACIKYLEEYEPQYNELVNEIRSIGSCTYRSEAYYRWIDLAKRRDAFQKAISKAKMVTYKGVDDFVKRSVEAAEETFNRNINVLATKLIDKGINTTKMSVKHIDDDNKYFELYITDGTLNLYARSILAAEYSDKMATHFRFIITNRK